MIDRIVKNEERLDDLLDIVKKLEDSLDKFKLCRKDFYLLNKYYGSKNWFKDKEALENGSIKVKAGVLSEDAIWNLDERVGDIILEMKYISDMYKR